MTAVLAAALTVALVGPAPASPGWTLLAPGAEHRRLEAGAIELFRFDLEAFRADVVVPGAAKPAPRQRYAGRRAPRW